MLLHPFSMKEPPTLWSFAIVRAVHVVSVSFAPSGNTRKHLNNEVRFWTCIAVWFPSPISVTRVTQRKLVSLNWLHVIRHMPIPVDAWHRAEFFGRLVAGIAGSNPARGMDVHLSCLNVVLSCVGRDLCDGLITRPEESYRVSVCVWLRNLKRGGQGPVWAVEALDGWNKVHVKSFLLKKAQQKPPWFRLHNATGQGNVSFLWRYGRRRKRRKLYWLTT
jgi:hypothetical protein